MLPGDEVHVVMTAPPSVVARGEAARAGVLVLVAVGVGAFACDGWAPPVHAAAERSAAPAGTKERSLFMIPPVVQATSPA